MKIGFSFGRCLGSIVRREVAFDDVLCIVARTRMDTEENVLGVVREYMHRRGYLAGLDQPTCEEIALRLFNSGKILEPRANKISPMQVPHDYIWMDLFPTAADGPASAVVRTAWEQYRMLLLLTEQLPEDNYVPKHSERVKPMTPEEIEKHKIALALLANAI